MVQLSKKQKDFIFGIILFVGGFVSGFLLTFFSMFIAMMIGGSINACENRRTAIISGIILCSGISLGLISGSYVWQPWPLVLTTIIMCPLVYSVGLFLSENKKEA